MKIIDLLNKIAKGEEVPNKIKWNDDEWVYNDGASKNYFNDYEDLFSAIDGSNLNDEVEIVEEEQEDNFSGIKCFADGRCYMSIASEPPKTKDIEEDKEIEKLGMFEEAYCDSAFDGIVFKKINKLIDEVNKLKRGE